MAKQTDKKKALVDKARRLFNYARNSSQYTTWLKERDEAYNLYDGYHWTQDELRVLEGRRQPPSVINKFAPKIDALSGVEIQTRTKISYKARSELPASRDVAAAFSYLAAYHQETLDVADAHSLVMKDMLISGLGWGECDTDGDNLIAGWVDNSEIIWDPDDTSQDLSNQMHLHRVKWLGLEDAIRRFPKYEKELRQLAISGASTATRYGTTATATAGYNYAPISGDDFSYFDKENQRVLIIETQYKELKDVWRVRTQGGTYATFMSEDEAKENAGEKAKPEKTAELVNKYIFHIDNICLDYGVSLVQGKHFSYIPAVLKRGRRDKVPYGLARAARYPQIEYNKRRSKALHLLNSKQVVMDTNAVESISELRVQISRPDGIIQKRPGSDLQIQDSTPLESGQVNLMQIASQELAEVTGIYDELLGQQTNALSGIAQERRQESSARTHAFAFALFKKFKKHFGEAMLTCMLHLYKEESMVRIMNNEKLEKIVRLNAVDTKGNKINNTAGLKMDIYVSQDREYASVPEEEAERLTNILMNGQGQMLVVPEIAAKLGFKEPEKIAETVKQLFMPSPQAVPAADGVNPTAGGPPANAPSLPIA